MSMAPGPPSPQTPLGSPGSLPLPGWLGPVVTLTTQVGVPTVVAGVLLWFVLFRVDGAMKVIQENEDARTKMVSAMQDSLVAALDRQTKSFEESIKQNIAANQRFHNDAKRDREIFLQRFPDGH